MLKRSSFRKIQFIGVLLSTAVTIGGVVLQEIIFAI